MTFPLCQQTAYVRFGQTLTKAYYATVETILLNNKQGFYKLWHKDFLKFDRVNINYKNIPILCIAIFYPIIFPFRCSYWWRDILSLGFSLDLPEPDVEALLHSAISPSSQPFSSRLFTLMTTNLLHVTIIIIMFFIF